MLGERGELVARARDDPLEVADEVGIHGVVARFERLQGCFARRDQDAKKRNLSSFGADEMLLARNAVSETPDRPG